MSDSTAFIDATSDTTTIIIIDSTSSDSENFTATVAFGMVSDFNSFMGPLGDKCNSLGGQFDSIKDQISGIGSGYTPGGVMDNAVANGLNEAYSSSKWAQGQDAVNMAKDVLDKCSFFKEMAPAFPKYGDPFKQIKSLGNAAVDKASAALEGALDKIKEATGYEMIEAQIGKQLAALTNTGRAVYDKVDGAVTDVAAAISPVIEYGKSAVSQTQTALSAATKELAKMDKLIDCLNTVGGPDFSPNIDAMNDQMNCYYDKLGVFSDPLLPNFGEFDVDNYLNTIGSLDPQAALNIKKSINMYSKAKNNAQGSIAKATDIAKKAKSATDPSATSQPIAQKTEAIATNTKGTQTIPGIPGKTETKTVDLPAPVPVGKPELPDPPVPTKGKVPFTTFIKEQIWVVEDDKPYAKYDPGGAYINKHLSVAYDSLSDITVEEPDTPPRIRMTVMLLDYAFKFGTDKDWLGREQYLLVVVGMTMRTILTNIDTGEEVWSTIGLNRQSNLSWTKNKDDLSDTAYRTPLFLRAVDTPLLIISYTPSEIARVMAS